jgi:hypothetical protein
MGREEPGDSHPIINEWGGHGFQVRASLSQNMVNLKCNLEFL